MDVKREKLFSGFPPVGRETWDARIREDLKGADYEKKMVWKTPEGINVKPFYTADDLQNLQLPDHPGILPFTRGDKIAGNAWECRQDYKVTETEDTALKIRKAIESRLNAIGLDLNSREDIPYSDFRSLIREIDMNCVSLHLISGQGSLQILDFLLQAIDELDIPSEKVKGSLAFDPMGHLTLTGGYYRSEEEDFAISDKLLMAAENELPGFRVLPVNSFIFGNAGANAVQEVAYGLSIAAEYLIRMTEMGHQPREVARHIQWNLGTGSSFFIELAKVRSARVLFSNLLSTFDSEQDGAVYINSVTTDWNKTIYDSYINILRLTTEAMAAILGGCNSLLVKPFDSCYREQANFSERISRNIQFILKEESHLDKVVDPAGGSYYIETLTASLVEHAWQLFLKTDALGGYIRAFTKGSIRKDLHGITVQRHQKIASRREILVGTNQYPNLHETMSGNVIPEMAFPVPPLSMAPVTESLVTGRAAEEFEKLRMAAENFHGGRPRVFILSYGNPVKRIARSLFSSNFFGCGGYEVIDNGGFKTVEEGVNAALEENAKIIVACSSDEEYSVFMQEVCDRVKGEVIVAVAGDPTHLEELKMLGISEFIHIRSNVLETLQHFHAELGIVY